MTRSWRVVAGTAAAVVALSACGSEGSPASSTDPVTATSASTSPSPAPSVTRAPQAPAQQPAEVDVSDVRMPFALEEFTVVDPGWTAVPQELDGVLIGPAVGESLVEFTAVTTAGKALWTAQRPLDASGFAVTHTSAGRPLAVLTDVTPASSRRTARALELATGEPVWGPVDVPGPLVGPGLVFAATEDRTDDAGSPVALDPDTGAEVGWDENMRVLGEFAGQVLVQTDVGVELRRASDGGIVWSVADVAGGRDAPLTATGSGLGGLVLLETGTETRTVLRLDSGQIIAEDILDAVLDATTSTLVATHVEGLRAFDADGEPLWANPSVENPELHAANGALVYTRDGPAVRVHNVVTGAVALAYQDSGAAIAVPEHFSPYGSAVISVDGRILLATAG